MSENLVSSTTYPFSEADEELISLSQEGAHPLSVKYSTLITTTSWTFYCSYCQWAHTNRKSMMNHLKRSHRNCQSEYTVEVY